MTGLIKCPNCQTDHLSEFEIKPGDKRTFKGNCKICNLPLKFRLTQIDHQGLLEQDFIQFYINGIEYKISNEYPLTMTLSQYIRDVLSMKGTKIMCREGGCGSCLVNAEVFDQTTKQNKNISINTCLFPLYSCNGMRFTTIEGLGGKKSGFHDIQKRIADKNGTQCGWCTPGMVMNMYSLLLKNPRPQKEEIESSMDGNICRCTGYRSILDAMKSFALDERPIDIEDLNKIKCLSKCSKLDKNIHLINQDEQWFTPKDMNSLYSLLSQYSTMPYRLVSGNTGTGVFKNDGPYKIYIDLKSIEELYSVQKYPSLLKIGSQVTLDGLISIFDQYSSAPGYEYLAFLSKHISKIANRGVRHVATWSGNLCMKNQHPEFPSDVFVCLETVNSVLTVVKSTPPVMNQSPLEFINSPLNGKLIYALSLFPFDPKTTFIRTYKIMPRSQNAHAYINAGFRFEIDPNTRLVKPNPCIIFGGISGQFNHANKTEQFLIGKRLNSSTVIHNACEILSGEIDPSDDPVLASKSYRRSLALSLFYKFVLDIYNMEINPKYKSAIESLIDTRPLSQGTHMFPDDDPNLYPVTKPMPKLNAYLQASGEAKYTFDNIALKNQLEGAFILSQVGNCRINIIDDSEAKKMPGVNTILYAKDIPGQNNFLPSFFPKEVLFCEDEIDYAGQAIGLVLADTFEQAFLAAKMVKVTYKDQKTPILNVFDGIKAGSFYPKTVPDFKYGNPDDAIQNSKHKIEGDVFLDSQTHFYMENQNAVCEETDDGYDIDCSTQWMDLVQFGASQILKVPLSTINVRIKQLGGAFGGKATRSNITACAAALGCYVTKRPVRVALDLNTCMALIGKRHPWYAKYKVGFDDDGKLAGINLDWYCDSGNADGERVINGGVDFVDNVYNCKNWFISSNVVKTNIPAHTAVRSPISFQAIAIMESIIEHISFYLKKDPLEVRTINLYQKGDTNQIGQPLTYFNADELISKVKESSDYENRVSLIEKFNNDNRWKKRGISLTPIKWGVATNGNFYSCHVSIYSADGSVSISHGGVEMGQGINTKIVQVAAYQLGIPMDIISIKGPDNFVAANTLASGGSVTTELVAKACIVCCQSILKNLEPIRSLMPPNYTWKDLINKAFQSGVDISARHFLFGKTDNPFEYCVYGAGVTEAEIDVLTGECQILRTDLLYDCGKCMNPEIDLGQAEGAFVMGLGFWLTEKIKYDPKTGLLLTDGTWEYKPPLTKDIPIDFRISFLKSNPNPVGVLGSKAVGEPPLCLSPSVAFAVKRAIEASRKEVGNEEFFPLNSPITVEAIQQLCEVDYKQFELF